MVRYLIAALVVLRVPGFAFSQASAGRIVGNPKSYSNLVSCSVAAYKVSHKPPVRGDTWLQAVDVPFVMSMPVPAGKTSEFASAIVDLGDGFEAYVRSFLVFNSTSYAGDKTNFYVELRKVQPDGSRRIIGAQDNEVWWDHDDAAETKNFYVGTQNLDALTEKLKAGGKYSPYITPDDIADSQALQTKWAGWVLSLEVVCGLTRVK